MKFWVLEDDALAGEVFVRMMRRFLVSDADVLHFEGPAPAFEDFERGHPVFVLMDTMMVGWTGEEAGTELRRRGYTGFLVDSGAYWPDGYDPSYADAVLEKPFSMRALRDLVATALGPEVLDPEYR